jgi:hypothetical protein
MALDGRLFSDFVRIVRSQSIYIVAEAQVMREVQKAEKSEEQQ